jgi:hypothetical protein
VDPAPDPLFFSGSAENRTRASRSVAKNSDLRQVNNTDSHNCHVIAKINISEMDTFFTPSNRLLFGIKELKIF